MERCVIVEHPGVEGDAAFTCKPNKCRRHTGVSNTRSVRVGVADELDDLMGWQRLVSGDRSSLPRTPCFDQFHCVRRKGMNDQCLRALRLQVVDQSLGRRDGVIEVFTLNLDNDLLGITNTEINHFLKRGICWRSPASSSLSSLSEMSSTLPLPSVVRSTVSSWITTIFPSLVR